MLLKFFDVQRTSLFDSRPNGPKNPRHFFSIPLAVSNKICRVPMHRWGETHFVPVGWGEAHHSWSERMTSIYPLIRKVKIRC